jgi:hypothetical protein
MLPLVAVAACVPTGGEGGLLLPDLAVTRVGPDVWLRGTRVVVEGEGFVPAGLGSMTATLTGTAGAATVAVKVDLGWDGPGRAAFVVGDALLAELPVDGYEIDGTITVERTGPGVSGFAVAPFAALVVSRLEPSIASVLPVAAWPGEPMTVRGVGFLLGGEGVTLLTLDGRWSGAGIADVSMIDGLVVPLQAFDRTTASFVLTPDVLGPGPGVFEGTASVANAAGDEEFEGAGAADVRIEVGVPYLSAILPATARRGQEVTFEGRGFLGVDATLGTATLFAFTGTVTGDGHPRTYTATSPLVVVPDAVDGNATARLVLRVTEGRGGTGGGLPSRPAVLDGTFTPRVVSARGSVVGQGLDATLTIGRTVQVVHLRFLPTFAAGLDTFGLSAVAEAVKARVLEVCRGDYTGFAVEFRTEAPGDFAEYTTVEVMARDPNDAGLLGLDNTVGKDVGNLRLDDLLGGYSAASEDAGFYAYGGVFVESFKGFSQALNPSGDMTAPEFDAVFAAFAPGAGGTPVAPGEWPGGGRDAAVAEAVRVMGNLIGDTVSHELGHALGLAAVEGEYHDPGDNEGFIMDAGSFRPFAERAQLPGAPERVWAPYDRAYLESILPVD